MCVLLYWFDLNGILTEFQIIFFSMRKRLRSGPVISRDVWFIDARWVASVTREMTVARREFSCILFYISTTPGHLTSIERAKPISYNFRAPYNELVSLKEMITKYARKVHLLSCSMRHPEDILK